MLDNIYNTKGDTQSNKSGSKGGWKENLERTTEQEGILKTHKIKTKTCT